MTATMWIAALGVAGPWLATSAAVDTKTAVREQVNKLDAGADFNLLAALMKDNPPAKEDAPTVEKLAKIGIVPGRDFDPAKVDATIARGLAGVPRVAQAKIMPHFMDAGSSVNGWTFTTRAGVHGTQYLQQAFMTAIGLGANRPQDAVYPTSGVDATARNTAGPVLTSCVSRRAGRRRPRRSGRSPCTTRPTSSSRTR